MEMNGYLNFILEPISIFWSTYQNASDNQNYRLWNTCYVKISLHVKTLTHQGEGDVWMFELAFEDEK